MKQTLTYHRKPNSGEIAFGYGATHYVDIPKPVCVKKDGRPKKWLNYKGSRWYY